MTVKPAEPNGILIAATNFDWEKRVSGNSVEIKVPVKFIAVSKVNN